MIRQQTLNKIRQKIDEHPKFNIVDFIITTKSDKIFIKYEYDNSFYFEAEIPTRTTSYTRSKRETQMLTTVTKDEDYEEYKFDGKVSPGQMTLIENFTVAGEYKFYTQISIWLDNLWAELLAIPVHRQFENQEKTIQDIKAKLENIPDTYFDYEEAEEIKKKIDTLEKQFQEKLNQEISDKEELKKQLDELHSEFNNLKATIHSVKRKGWMKSLFTKTFIWVSKEENRKFLKDTKDFITPLLPENVKDILP